MEPEDIDHRRYVCVGPIWDTNLTWNTESPEFTPCFHNTVVVGLPLAFLLLFAPLQSWWAWRCRDRGIAPGLATVIRMVLTVALVVLPTAGLASGAGPAPNDLSELWSPAGKSLSYSLALVLHVLCLLRGLVTSGPVFTFWLLKLVCSAFTMVSFAPEGVMAEAYGSSARALAIVEYCLVVAVFLCTFWADPKPSHCHGEEGQVNLSPEKYSSFPSKLAFFWFDRLARKGWNTVLNVDDLWSIPLDKRAEEIVPAWEKQWEKEELKAKAYSRGVTVLPALIRTFGPSYGVTMLLQLCYSVLQFASPQIVNLLITFVQSDEPIWRGYFYTGLIVAVMVLTTILNSQCFYIQYVVGLRVKTALTSAIYRKALKLSNVGRKDMSVGETVNLMSIDTQKFMDVLLYFNMIWASPLQIALAIYFLWQILGPSALAGLAVMVVMLPLNGVIAGKLKNYQLAQMSSKDRRTALMDEVLSGIKVVKLYAWEEVLKERVLAIRKTEMSALIKSAYMNSMTTFMWTSAPFLVALASFVSYVLSDPSHVLDANTAFVSLTLFNLLRVPLNFVPMLMVYVVQCGVSLKRLDKFMNADELDEDSVSRCDGGDPIVLEDASFSWDRSAAPVVEDVRLRVKKGSLVAVVGQVGCGKSSLISAILGEMHRVGGSARVAASASTAYVPQQAWLQNATLRDNVLFGKEYDAKLYDRVVESCGLAPDLEMLPAGDGTEIGERGINLSGGQKQRISVARAVYSNADVYLLDDPLSAVDSHVGKHIFGSVIGPRGLLKNKTVVLATHGIGYLKDVDRVVVMKDGRVTEQGSYGELLAAGGEFAEFLLQHIKDDEEGADPETESELEGVKAELEAAQGKAAVRRKLREMSPSSSNGGTATTVLSDLNRHRRREEQREKEPEQKRDRLIEEEKAEVGGVKLSVYFGYAKAVGLAMSAMAIVLYCGFQGFQVGSNIWLARWSVDPAASTDIGVRNVYLIVYGMLGILQAVFMMFATAIVLIATLKATTKLHANMLAGILHSTMAFFDTTPLGRILNRFSKDVDILDITIPMNIRTLLEQLFVVMGTMVVICYTNPWFVVVVLPVCIAYYVVQKFYVMTARQVKRLESITRSPIYSHFSETITGGPTLRAYGSTGLFVRENERRVDENQKCYFPTFVSSRWLSVRLETVGNVIVLFASLFAVLFRDRMDPGKVGLSLSYALNITMAMHMLVRMTSEIETNMVSAERIMEYQMTPQEAPAEAEDGSSAVPEDWPRHGVVKFDHYKTRYREGLDLVLRDIHFETMSGEKVGIVGRTGAGKSSLTLSLFRIVEAAGGSIYIDGENVAFMGLAELRSKLTIIPQDPFLFSATMRMNLDPHGRYGDAQMWAALEVAHLKSYVANLPGGLGFEVNEGGENLSVGQRQLVCLARAILRKTKVLVLDEATAAVDLETDDLIQKTIRSEFGDCTVITIAHRLNTILDSSRVIVLDQGKIKEFDTPQRLLADRGSQFHSMVRDAGLLDADGELLVAAADSRKGGKK